MKKMIIVLIGVLLLSCLLIYVLIPTVIIIRKSISIENNLNGLRRSLSDSTKWAQWWPGEISSNKKILDEKEYRLTDITFSSLLIDINRQKDTVKTSFNIIPLNNQSVTLEWGTKIYASYNPYIRLKTYLYAQAIGKDFSKVLKAAKTYYSNSESVYGLDIKRDTVKNSSLIFTIDSSQGYPSTEKIYSMLAELRKYIAYNNATIIDSPMLNINSTDSVNYITRVAIPTDRKLASNGKIQYRWMLGGGNILSAEIKGDNRKVDSALAMVEKYVQDYELVAPAKPFYSLVTNRLALKDSNSWVTKIYYPIMYFNKN